MKSMEEPSCPSARWMNKEP
jgi:hypothetical protein